MMKGQRVLCDARGPVWCDVAIVVFLIRVDVPAALMTIDAPSSSAPAAAAWQYSFYAEAAPLPSV